LFSCLVGNWLLASGRFDAFVRAYHLPEACGRRPVASRIPKNFCKDGNNFPKIPLFCSPNFIEMKKKIAIALLIAFVSGIIMTSCKSNASCPAYGESQKFIKETRY